MLISSCAIYRLVNTFWVFYINGVVAVNRFGVTYGLYPFSVFTKCIKSVTYKFVLDNCTTNLLASCFPTMNAYVSWAAAHEQLYIMCLSVPRIEQVCKYASKTTTEQKNKIRFVYRRKEHFKCW